MQTSARTGGFKPERSVRLLELERTHFWFDARRRLIASLIARHIAPHSAILDIGCGSAFMAQALVARGHRVVALDRSELGLRAWGASAHIAPGSSGPAAPLGDQKPEREGAASVLKLRADACALPVRAGAFRAALALDLLEHVDDRAALRALHRALAPAGVFVLTVPALPSLFGFRDEDAGHLRRYERASLCRLLEATGFEVLETHYYQCLLFPLLALSRVLGRSSRAMRDREESPRWPLNRALSAINHFEVGLSPFVRWPIGSSLAVASRRRP